MAITNFKTTNSTFRQLIGNGLTYRIPTFQRDYSWGEEEWEDLWVDLAATLTDEEPAHYMGYLVLQSDDEKTFDVIDGQQRLTTLTLLVLAVLKHFQRLIDRNDQKSEANKQRADELRRTFVGSLDPVSLATHSKLSLNRNNDEYFQKYLVPLERLPQRGRRVSEHALRKAFEWFDKRVESWMNRGPDAGKELAQLVLRMSDRLFFTVINVTDDLNAYKVFETLNARGVKLSSTDLLKNYLFSVINRDAAHRDELPLLEGRWDSLVSRLEDEGFPEFLRIHWLSRGRFVRHADLFKQVRRDVTDRAAVFALVRALDADLERFLSLRDPSRSSLPPTSQRLAQQLRLYGVTQPYPLLLAAQRDFEAAEFEKLLRACMIISLRYNVICGFSPGDQEPVYAEVAKGVADRTITHASQAITGLSRIYPSDEQFETNFVEKVFSPGKKKLVRHLLCELEAQNSNLRIDADSDTLSIEHVLPLSPEDGSWPTFSPEDHDTMVWRLSNLVLMRKTPNSRLGNAEWAEKRVALRLSEFPLTKALAEENAEWTPDRLMARQRQLAKLAGALWRIPQLS